MAADGTAVNYYCTYFDRNYLAQGLALWRSLAQHDPAGELTVLALDETTATVLRRLNDGRLRIVERNHLLAADVELAAAESTRSRTEFLFALTPCLVRYLMRVCQEIDRLVYLDADLFFFDSPAPIWEELASGSVLIVPHRFPAWHNDAVVYGRYNVGVVGFIRTESANACVTWWREQCLRSTALVADGERYGDQKYLDKWPARWAGVIESTHPGVNVAPWNWARHEFGCDRRHVRVDDQPLIVFHFAQFKRIDATWFDSGQLEYGVMPRRLRSWIYGPYSEALLGAEAEIRRVQPDFSVTHRGWRASLGAAHLALLRIFCGQFWCHVGDRWFALGVGLGAWSGHVMGSYRRWQRRCE